MTGGDDIRYLITPGDTPSYRIMLLSGEFWDGVNWLAMIPVTLSTNILS